jgi:uncharacterized protein (DUF58 family)
MSPSNKLILWAGILLIPFAVLSAFSPVAAAITVALVGGGILLAGIDAAISFRRLVPLELDVPEVVRLSKQLTGTIDLKVKSSGRAFNAVRFGLPLPPDIPAEHDSILVNLPKPDQWYRLRWTVMPKQCGCYGTDACYIETDSILGLWLIRRSIPAPIEMRVYPNLRGELRRAAAQFLNRGDYGGHIWRQIGKGRDFEKLREYIPGDTYQDIHWKTTAKRNRPITKVYQIERTQEIYVVLDSSRLSARRVGSMDDDTSVTLLERYIRSTLMLAAAAEAQGDLFGLIQFGAKPNLFLKASSGKAHFDSCRNALYTLLPEEASPDFSELVSFIRTRLRKRALLIFLTSLDDTAEAERFKESIPLLSRHHLTLVNMLCPDGAQPLFSGDPIQTTSELYTQLGGHIAWRKLHELERHLKTIGVQMNLLNSEHLTPELITQYMQIKQKQLI